MQQVTMKFATGLAVATLAAMASAGTALGQALVADRPDFTEGPGTVGRGAGVGLNERAEDVFFGTGFAVRLLKPES